MMNFQKIVLVGNLTADAQQKTSKDGKVSFTTFRVAVSDAKDRPAFFPVTVFGKQGEAIAAYLTKGRQVLVEGRVEVSEKGYASVVADRVKLGSPSGKQKTDEAPPLDEPVTVDTAR